MKTQRHIKILEKIGACREAREWAGNYPTAQVAWDACERGDWMLWLLGRLSGKPATDSRKKVVLAACECARLALPQYEVRFPDDKRPRTAIETAESHCSCNDTLKKVRTAANAAYAAAYAASAASAASAAADAAASAAYAAAASAAADAAASAAYAAAADANAAYSEARFARLKECADIVRKHFPAAPEIE